MYHTGKTAGVKVVPDSSDDTFYIDNRVDMYSIEGIERAASFFATATLSQSSMLSAVPWISRCKLPQQP